MNNSDEEKKFAHFCKTKIFFIVDALERFGDSFDRDCINPIDLSYGISQMERLSDNAATILRILSAAKKMFDGVPKVNAWKESSPTVPWTKTESEALDSLGDAIALWKERN